MAVHFLASFLDKASGLFSKKSLPSTIELYDPITVSRPDVEFRVLSSLAKQNVYFIDLDTTNYIDGLIYLPSLGLTLTPPPPPQKASRTNLGFLNLETKREVSIHSNQDVAEIDAVLYFEYEGRECKTGLLDNGLAYLFFIKIWNDLDFIIWEKILEKVVGDLTLDLEGYLLPRVNFTVATTFIPNKPMEASKLVINRQDENSDASFAVSSLTVSAPNDDEEFDDDEEYEELKTPKPRH